MLPPPAGSRSTKLKRAASNVGSSSQPAGERKKKVRTPPKEVAIGQDALRVCHYANSEDVASSDQLENDFLWVGKKSCSVATLQEVYPGLCWPSLMSHLKGSARFGVCMQPEHPDHQDCSTKAHALTSHPFAEVRQYFQ